MQFFTGLTVAQKKDLRDGKTVILTAKDSGKRYIITPGIIAHAREQLASGAGEIRGLPEVEGTGLMEEVVITL
jgi:hypothetical protein